MPWLDFSELAHSPCSLPDISSSKRTGSHVLHLTRIDHHLHHYSFNTEKKRVALTHKDTHFNIPIKATHLKNKSHSFWSYIIVLIKKCELS